MKIKQLGVGVIGASSDGTWGGLAHLPALQALPHFKVAAICTTRQESADETAKRFGIPHAFTDPYELALHPDVDLVTITVKVPEHDNLVHAALAAGKHVFSEFPLGRTTGEAIALLQAAENKGVRHFVGLQARANPALLYAKDLITSGYVGKVLAVHCNYSVPVFPIRSKQIQQSRQYLLDDVNGAHQLTITAGHLLDGIHFMLGTFSEISAILETQSKQVRIAETGEIVHATSPDHVVVNGILTNGAVFSCQIRNTHVGSLSLEINGTEGDLILQSNDNYMFQIDSFVIKGAHGNNKSLEELPVPEKYNHSIPAEIKAGPALNVALLYMQLYKDLLEDSYQAPNFRTAVAAHKLLDKVRLAGDTRSRLTISSYNL